MQTITFKQLADAMRIGAAKTIQCTGELYKTKTGIGTHRKDRAAASCALGAIYIGYPGRGVSYNPVMESSVIHPVNFVAGYRLRDTIVNLNDSYKWSRERIADWLETLKTA